MKNITDYFLSPTKTNASKNNSETVSSKLPTPKITEPEKTHRNKTITKTTKKCSPSTSKTERGLSNVRKLSNEKTKDKNKNKPQFEPNPNCSSSSSTDFNITKKIGNDSEIHVESSFITNSKSSCAITISDKKNDIISNNTVIEGKDSRKTKLQLKLKSSKYSQEDHYHLLDCVEINSQVLVESISIDSQILDSSTTSKASLNAFKFLMDSRSNVIGQNTEGKELRDDSSFQKEEKNKLDKQKSFLQDWADKKAGAKRKRDEIEIDKCISKKLEKRAKRLKKMLRVEETNRTLQKQKRKRVINIDSSDSECSKSSINENTPISTNQLLLEIDEEAQDTDIMTQKNDSNQKITEYHMSFNGIFDKAIMNNTTNNTLDKGEVSTKSNKGKLSLKTDNQNNSEVQKPQIKFEQINSNECEIASESQTPKKQCTLSGLYEISRSSNKASQDFQPLTPRTQKNWKMKIKLNQHIHIKGAQPDSNTAENEFENNEDIIIECSQGFSSKSEKDNDDQLQDTTINSSDSEDEKPLSKLTKKYLKIAPVFSNATQKRVDEKTLEARRNFLMSGTPSSIKKTLERHKRHDERPLNIFPDISHVQQICDHDFWNFPQMKLHLRNYEGSNVAITDSACENLIQPSFCSKPLDITHKVFRVHNVTATLNQIKQDNPDYPVFKAFRHISEKSGKALSTEKTNSIERRGRKSKKSIEIQRKQVDASCTKENEVWTEKYKAQRSEEILGNHKGVSKLKRWLETWMTYSEEINSNCRKNCEYDSSSEFGDSRESVRLPGNTVVVGGPNGSGKTSAIYAIANELGFNILEVNASSKRTGKKLQQELQEATRSHQVKKKEIKSIFSMKTDDSKSGKKTDLKSDENIEENHKKMCILLVEDVDIIFEQDEGFIFSLTQLIATSKRPIILTTTDTGPNHIQKLLSQHEFISFTPLSMNTLSVWLQLVCLAEGLLIDQRDLGNLLEFNKGDIRKTLLELQFWVQSSGQLDKDGKIPLLTEDNSRNCEQQSTTDEEFIISLNNYKTESHEFKHKNIFSSFVVFQENTPFNVPKGISLGTLWWNTPNIFNANVPQRRHKSNNHTQQSTSVKITSNKSNIQSILRYYDSLVISDMLGQCSSSAEPIINDWYAEEKNSLELNERMDEANASDFVGNLSHFLLDRCVEDFRKRGHFRGLNMALPNSTERRWRAKQHICEDFLKEPLTLCSALERGSVTLDYLPWLRSIARSEKIRSSLNTKRRNRFRHYFRNLNMNFDENVCKMVSDVLILNDS